MTSFMEKCGLKGKKLYSPVPFKTSFIPAHYTFDTTSVAQLFMNGDRIKSFKRRFEKTGGTVHGRVVDLHRGIQEQTDQNSEPVVQARNQNERYKSTVFDWVKRLKNSYLRPTQPQKN